MGVTNTQLLRAIEHIRDMDLAEIKAKLDALNGRQRETEQAVSGLKQWQDDTRDEIKSLRNRTNLTGIVLALAQLVVASVGAILFGKDGRI